MFSQRMKMVVLISNYRPQFYLRTADVTRNVDLLESVKMVMRGDNVTTAFELTTPVVLEPGPLLLVFCKYVSFLLCSIDTNGSTMKPTMLNNRVVKALHKWHQKVKN